RAAGGGTLFEAARERAEQVVGELAPDSEVVVVLAGNEPRVLISRASDTTGAGELLSQAQLVGGRGSALGRALSLGLRELTASKLPAKELLVLSDCAAHADADALESAAGHLRVE